MLLNRVFGNGNRNLGLGGLPITATQALRSLAGQRITRQASTEAPSFRQKIVQQGRDVLVKVDGTEDTDGAVLTYTVTSRKTTSEMINRIVQTANEFVAKGEIKDPQKAFEKAVDIATAGGEKGRREYISMDRVSRCEYDYFPEGESEPEPQ